MLVNMTGGKKVENIINEIVEPVLLWTNPSPNYAFNPQTITVETGYSAYLVEFNEYINPSTNAGGATFTCYLPFSTTSVVLCNANGARTITSAANGSIAFGAGHTTDRIYSNNNWYGVPYRIWGVKYTL